MARSRAAATGDTVGGALRDGAAQAAQAIKPKLRGWIHAGMFPLVLAAAIVLVALSPTDAAKVSTAVFGLTSVLLFGVSAVYHRGTWSPRVTGVLRRVIDAAYVAGAPLFAGWCDLPEPEDPRALAMHQLNALRELRGGMHGAAVLTVGLLPVEAITVRTPNMLGVYGWPDESLDPEPFHQRWGLAEARTDRMFGRALAVLDDDTRGALVEFLGTLEL